MADDLQRKIIAKVYSRVSAVVMGICDEGDRVYFGTSNDADILRDLRDEWDAHKIMGEEILSSEQEVAALKVRAKADADRITALQAQNRKLVEALVEHNDLMRSTFSIAEREGVKGMVASTNWDAFYNRVAVLLKRHHTLANEARAAIAEAEKGEG